MKLFSVLCLVFVYVVCSLLHTQVVRAENVITKATDGGQSKDSSADEITNKIGELAGGLGLNANSTKDAIRNASKTLQKELTNTTQAPTNNTTKTDAPKGKKSDSTSLAMSGLVVLATTSIAAVSLVNLL